MKTSKFKLNKLVLFLLIPLLASCTSFSYSPRLTLEPATKKMNLVVSVETFEDKKPIEDTQGHSITSKESFAEDLGVIVTKEVMTELSRNAFFKNIAFNADNPDLIMKGEIRHFKGRIRTTAGYWAGVFLYCVPWLVGVPMYSQHYDIELAIMLYDKENNFIKEYTSSIKDEQYLNLYNSGKKPLVTESDKRFNKVVTNIMSQIITDTDFIQEKVKKAGVN